MNAEDNRKRFPETAKIVDEFRRVFGDGVKVKWAVENGRSIGRVPTDAEVE